MKELLGKVWTIVRRAGWRVAAVVGAAVVAVLITWLLYALGAPTNPATHQGAVFASWVAGVATFIFAGAAVALVQLIPPEMGSFDSRARILFKGQSGAHIDYIVKRIQEFLEQYSEETMRTLKFTEWHEGDQKFFVESDTTTKLRNYVDDATSTAKSRISVKKTCEPPQGARRQRLAYVRVNGSPTVTSQAYDDKLDVPFDTPVAKGGVGLVENGLENWVLEGEANIHRPLRYTQSFILKVENKTSAPIRLTVAVEGGSKEQTHLIAIGENRTLLEIKDINPGTVAYDLRAFQD